jgi:hypothetical protein
MVQSEAQYAACRKTGNSEDADDVVAVVEGPPQAGRIVSMNDNGLQSRGQSLLSLARTIRHYEAALNRAQGENFNLFDILHVGHYEVRTHSPILAELLNPQGSHGQGAVFLQHFLDVLQIGDFKADKASVETEVSIGEHGRIDIVITDGSSRRRIFIENKIHAELQDRQLERYHEHDPKADLLFLTLKGDPPPDGPHVDNLKNVSYQSHILSWLERCRKEAATAPGLREAITQYIHLIQRLTQQNTNAQMNGELIKAVLQDKESYLAYANIRNLDWEIRRQIIEKLNEGVRGGLPKGLTLVKSLDGRGESGEHYVFSTPELEARHLLFAIQFEKGNYEDAFFGFTPTGQDTENHSISLLQDAFKAEFGACRESTVWPAWEWYSPSGWNDDVFVEILFGEFQQEVIKLVERLRRVADAVGKVGAVVPESNA